MCGRSCCTLSRLELQKNSKYLHFNEKEKKWFKITPNFCNNYNMGRPYEPSFNLAPTDMVPTLVSKYHVTEEPHDYSKRSVLPMMWGIVPRWHKGHYLKHGFHTNNARLEGLMENRIFKQPLLEGQRCVLLCEGFYEWSTTGVKKPYFVHAPQKDEKIRIEDRDTWPSADEVVLLKMAGLYDIYKDEKGEEIYGCTVLTRESDDVLSWMHHRTPLVLETEEDISDWLDFHRVGPEEAIKKLKAPKSLRWHEVSTHVNNSRHKTKWCNKPLSQDKDGEEPPRKMLITDHFRKVTKDTKE